MWTVYAKSDWTPALKKEYKSFWTEVVDIYKKRLSQLQTQKSFAVQPNEQYHILRDRTCSEGEFYLQHPKTQKTCKCLVRKGLKLRKSWSSKMQGKYAGSRWVTITDPSSPLKGRHILIVPHKDGTASIAWAPSHSGLTHKILQPKEKKAKDQVKPKEKEKKKIKELSEEQHEKFTTQKRELISQKQKQKQKLHEMIREKVGVETTVTKEEKKEIEEKVSKVEKEKQPIERLKEYNKIQNKRKEALNSIISEAKNVMLGDETTPPEQLSAQQKNIREAIKENAEDFLKSWYTIKGTERELRTINKFLKTGNVTRAGSDIVEMETITTDDLMKTLQNEKAVESEIDAHYNLIINTRGGIDRDGNEISGKGTGSLVMQRHIATGALEAITGLTGEMAGTSMIDADIAKELGSANVAVLADYYLENTAGSDYGKRMEKIRDYIETKGSKIAQEAMAKGDKYIEMAQRVRQHAKGEKSLYGSVQQGTAASLAYTNRAYEAYGQAEGALNQVAEMLHQFEVKKEMMVIKATNRPALNRKLKRLGLNKSDTSIVRHGYGDYELRIPKRSFEKLIEERVIAQFKTVAKEPTPESIIAGRENTDHFQPSMIKTHLAPDADGNMQRIIPTEAQQSAARLVGMQKKVYLNWEAGTGKSLAYLEAISQASDKAGKPLKTIISMPKKLMGNFREEVEKFTNYKVEIVSGDKKSRVEKYKKDPNTIVVINKEKYRKDQDYEEIKNAGFDMIIADEAHKITQRSDTGSKGSMMSHGLAEIAKQSEYFIAGTGTPTPNNLSELYFHLNIMDPDKYSSQKAFMDKYKHLHKGAGLKEKLAQIMNAELSDRVMTQKKDAKNKFFENIHRVDLTDKQRKEYKNTQKRFREGKILGITRDQLLTSVLNSTHHSENNKYAKMKNIIDHHLKTKGDSEKVLIYAKNYETVRMIEDFLKTQYPDQAIRFTGQNKKGSDMSIKQIASNKNKYLTDGKVKFAIHTDAGTEGLNLQHTGEKDRPYGATTVIAMASGMHSYSVLDQFFSRANRKGATKDVHGHLILTDSPHDMATEERLGDKRTIMNLIHNGKVRDENGVLGTPASKSIFLKSIRMKRKILWAAA